MTTMKRCCRCKEHLPLDEFYKNSAQHDGLHVYCKTCARAANRESLARRPGYDKRYYEAHKERLKVYSRDWKRKNNKRARELLKGYNHERRARLAGVPCDKTISMDILFVRDKGFCGICRNSVELQEASIDHIVPIARGGSHTWDNVQLSHLPCNLSKGARM